MLPEEEEEQAWDFQKLQINLLGQQFLLHAN